MEYRPLGRIALRCSAVGLGTWKTFNVTSSGDKRTCRRVVDEMAAGGANLYDSSPMYGHSEHVLAECLMGRRESAVVATKVWAHSVEEARRQIRDGLTFFEGKVDLYQVHNLSLTREVLEMLEAERAKARVRAIGATHYQPSAFDDLLAWMETGRLDAIQIPYSVGERTVERDILPAAARLGLGVLVMLPLQQGKLVAKAPAPESLRPFAKFGCTTWPQVLLKWVLSDPRIDCVIPATSRPERVPENAAAGSPPWLGPDERELISRLAENAAR